MERTMAWVVKEGSKDAPNEKAEFALEEFEIPTLQDNEALLEPLWGSWEGNYGHAIDRRPIDVCRARGESRIVLGNCGVVRVLKPSADGNGPSAGEVCLLTGNAVPDRFGYMVRAHAYDAPNTMGIMAKRMKAQSRQLIPIPTDHPSINLQQWAAFSLRYITAWANWRVAYGSWRLQVSKSMQAENYPVWAWGGGVSFAQLQLAKFYGAEGTLISSKEARLELARSIGIKTLNRSEFSDLDYRPKKYANDPGFKERYGKAEKIFLQHVKEATNGEGVAIFIDNIGQPVFRATLKALAREGVVATAGWKHGMALSFLRAQQCICRQTFVHTHYASDEESLDAVKFALENHWVPPQEALSAPYAWEDLSQLANDFNEGSIDSYFPMFSINPE